MSVSGIGESTLADVDAFCAEMDARSVPVSLLVAPRMRDDYRLDRDPRTVDWLTGRRAAGDALVLHGYDEAATKRRRGEFAMLRAHEANLRLMAATGCSNTLGCEPDCLRHRAGWYHQVSVQRCRPMDFGCLRISMESRIWFGSPPCVPACWASARVSWRSPGGAGWW